MADGADDFDMASALASMDESFGSEGESQAPASEPAGESAPSLRNDPAAAPTTQVPAAPTPAEWESLPKAWRQDMEAHWRTMTPEARQYVHAREKQQLEGIMKYKGAADKWDATLKPFERFIKENQLDPYESVARLGAVELVLRNGSPQEKQQYLAEMIRFYGLEPVLRPLLGQPPAQTPQFQRDPMLNQVQQELHNLRQWQTQQLEAVSMQQVDAFLADPKNVYAKDLIPDMSRILGEGRAADLPSAYEQALWLNPDVRQKVLADEVKKATTAPAAPPRLVRSNATRAPAPTEAAQGSMEDTMRATLKAIQARG
jgi:hypothetical protein